MIGAGFGGSAVLVDAVCGYGSSGITNLTNMNSPANATPSILGIWRLGKPIHTGRSAALNLAQPADSEGSPRWDYVLKRAVGAQNQAENARQIAQFTSAAQVASHPNLIPVLDASVTGASPYLVMPRLEGTTMQQQIDADVKPLPVALWLIRQVAQSLVSMHDAGWVHCDIKPENIMVGPRGHVTVIDLGFATRIHTVSTSTFRGTPEYAAPEMMQDNMAAMPSADIFALGRILWKWLTCIEPASESMLEPVADLVQLMVCEQATMRPDAATITRKLLRLEIDTLGQHIGPTRRAA